jgi:hypothetical protein
MGCDTPRLEEIVAISTLNEGRLHYDGVGLGSKQYGVGSVEILSIYYRLSITRANKH